MLPIIEHLKNDSTYNFSFGFLITLFQPLYWGSSLPDVKKAYLANNNSIYFRQLSLQKPKNESYGKLQSEGKSKTESQKHNHRRSTDVSMRQSVNFLCQSAKQPMHSYTPQSKTQNLGRKSIYIDTYFGDISTDIS